MTATGRWSRFGAETADLVVGREHGAAPQVNLSYDTNPYDSSSSQYSGGRPTARKFTISSGSTLTEMFSYTPAGQISGKRLRVSRFVSATYPYQSGTLNADLNGAWSYDSEGRMGSVTYPLVSSGNGTAGGETYTYGYDSMGRLNTMTNSGTNRE